MNALHGIADGIGPFLILLGLLIFVHELGHFLVAKLCGVRVEVFSLGFGKKILQYKRGDTNYCISIIPLGGYVKMFGDDPNADISSEQRQYSFLHKPVSQRIAIVLAGPLMNLVFAYFLFVLIPVVGEPVPGPFVGDVAETSRAYEAGFRSGDKVLSVNGEPVDSWLQVKDLIGNSVNERLAFEVEREHSTERAQISVTPVLGENDNILSHKSQIGVIGGLDALSVAALIGVVNPESPAAKAGLKSLDLITKINDRPVENWRELEKFLMEDLFKGRTPVVIQVESYASGDQPVPRTIELPVPDRGDLEMKSSHGQAATTLPRTYDLHELGIEQAQLYLWKVKPKSPADVAGLKAGDRVVAVNGQPINDWTEVIGLVKTFNPDGEPMQFTYRRDGQEMTAKLVPEMTELIDAKGKDDRRFTVGIVSGFMQSPPKIAIHHASGVADALMTGIRRTGETTVMIVMGLVKLIQGDVSARNIGGIISIGRFANQSYEMGLATFLRTMALISINLFLINLLPVPILDGGHLVFFSIEALRGAPLSMRKMEIAQQVGLVLLMSLMIFALFNDISNWLSSAW